MKLASKDDLIYHWIFYMNVCVNDILAHNILAFWLVLQKLDVLINFVIILLAEDPACSQPEALLWGQSNN